MLPPTLLPVPRLILHTAPDEPARDLAPVHAWLCDVDDERQLAGVDEGALSASEEERARRLVDPEKGRRFRRGRAVVRHVLGRLLGVPPRDVDFAVNAHGKPSVVTPRACGSRPAPPLHVNWSHSANLLLLAATVSGEVGVDVEVMDPAVDALAVAQSHFTRAEADALRALAGPERTAAFYRCWTVKEAVLKALGTGLSVALNRVSVQFGGAGAMEISLDGEPVTHAPGWHLHCLEFPSGANTALGAVAVRVRM